MHPLKEQTEELYQSMIDRVPETEVKCADPTRAILLLFPPRQRQAVSDLCT